MDMQSRNNTPIGFFILLSIAVHGLALSLPDCLRTFEFTRPVIITPVELVEVNTAKRETINGAEKLKSDYAKGVLKQYAVLKTKTAVSKKEARPVNEIPATTPPAKPLQQLPDVIKETPRRDNRIKAVSVNETTQNDLIGSGRSLPTSMEALQPKPQWEADEIIASKHEKLTFRILMFGLSVGSAVLEAVNDSHEVKISSTVSSNTVISAIYPVSDYAETRLMGGRFIISRVKQREGDLTSDTGFTLDLPGKTVHWVDRLRNSFDSQKLPREDLLDILAGFYYLRNKRLEVGVPVILQLYDSDQYAETTVEILRREHVSLPGFGEVEALVVHPMIRTDSIFRRASDILVWLTDDEFKVPVRFETTIPLGKVTAELISAESDSPISPPHRQSLSRR